MDDLSIKSEGVLWLRADAPLRTFYTDDNGVDHDLTHIGLRDDLIGAAFAAMVELVGLVEDAKKMGFKNPRTEDLIAKIDALLGAED